MSWEGLWLFEEKDIPTYDFPWVWDEKVLKWAGEDLPFCKIKSCKIRLGDMEMSKKQAPWRLNLVEVNLVTAI